MSSFFITTKNIYLNITRALEHYLVHEYIIRTSSYNVTGQHWKRSFNTHLCRWEKFCLVTPSSLPTDTERTFFDCVSHSWYRPMFVLFTQPCHLLSVKQGGHCNKMKLCLTKCLTNPLQANYLNNVLVSISIALNTNYTKFTLSKLLIFYTYILLWKYDISKITLTLASGLTWNLYK